MDPLLGFRQLRRTRDAVDVAEGCVPNGAKVAQLPAGRREEQVLGLDVAVCPAVRVQVREPAAHLSEDGEHQRAKQALTAARLLIEGADIGEIIVLREGSAAVKGLLQCWDLACAATPICTPIT